MGPSLPEGTPPGLPLTSTILRNAASSGVYPEYPESVDVAWAEASAAGAAWAWAPASGTKAMVAALAAMVMLRRAVVSFMDHFLSRR